MAQVSTFVCGVQKGGTTSLFEYLRSHPDLAAPYLKEPHFFDNESIDWNRPDYGILEAAFPVDDGRQRFEATPIYSFWPPAMERIQAYNPKARLIFLFRDPCERAWSHWCMAYARGEEDMLFAEAIREGRARIPSTPVSEALRQFSYVERGFYASQVRRAMALFPADQLLFLRSRDLAHDQHATLARIASFLGLAPFPTMAPKRACVRPVRAWPCYPTQADHALLSRLLRPEVEAFAELTGLDVSGWLTMAGASPSERASPATVRNHVPCSGDQAQASCTQ